MDMEKIRRETLRWQILLTLKNASPIGCFESIILSVVRAEYSDASRNEIRQHLEYLKVRSLIKIDKQPDGRWHCELDRFGYDLVDYTVDCEPGIARPEKYDA